MSDETSAAIADDTKLVAGIIRAHFDAGQVRYKSGMTDAELCEFYNGYAMVIRRTLAGRAAASSDLDAIKREAAWKAWECLAKQLGTRVYVPPAEMFNEARDRYLAETYPAPVPEPPHVKSAPVEYEWHDDGYKKQVYAEKGTGRIVGSVDGQSAYIVGTGLLGRYITPEKAREAVVRVLALREGRGDGHADAN